MQAAVRFRQSGELAKAEALCGQVLARDPQDPDALGTLGLIAHQLGRNNDAQDLIRRALVRRPDDVALLSNLGTVSSALEQFDEAVDLLEQAVARHPRHAVAQNNLGLAYLGQGRVAEAIERLRHAIRLEPRYVAAHGSLLHAMLLSADVSDEDIAAERAAWARRHATPLAAHLQPHQNDRSADRRMRLGYLCGHFARHAAGRNIEPALAHHDHAAFEVFCYSNAAVEDDATSRMKGYADTWRPIACLTDDAAAEQIRGDRIDILIDLNAHMRGGRPLLVARKPAPVQVGHVAYPAASGIPTIDYRITDPYLDPADDGDARFERPVRLPHSYWIYQADAGDPPPELLPRTSGGCTFGSLNMPAKVSEPCAALWSRVLAAVPGSRLLLLCGGGSETRRRFAERFERYGMKDRLEFVDRLPRGSYLRQYHRIDVVLDPFPYNGHTTTCDALWMGVPVVTLRGSRGVGRGGASLLSNVNRTEWIAENPDDFVRIAVSLASDEKSRQTLRSKLRQDFASSPLMDAASYTRALENAYRQMWRAWATSPR